MAAFNGFSEEDERRLRLRIELINEASDSIENYLKIQSQIAEEERQLNESLKQHREFLNKIRDVESRLANARRNNNRTLINQLELELAAKEQAREESERILELAQEELELKKDALAQVKVRNALGRTTIRQAKELGKLLLKQSGYLLEQQKAVKNTELSMGLLTRQSSGFRQNIYRTSLRTNEIGVNTAQLAKIQGTYSDEIGRAVQLSSDQLEAVAELAQGTTLGAEGAAEFAANFDTFGVSAKSTAKLVETMLNNANKMGVNGNKSIRNLQRNIGIANKYNFKNGLRGLTDMVNLSTKFKLEMSEVSNFADNLMNPEGAVETAARLQTLGGAWAQLGNPFELMFRSRNDLTGLTKDIIEATTQSARFNEETQEFMIDPMELHRLREVANATGLSYDNLAKTAKEAAKIREMGSKLNINVTDEELEFISSLSTFNKQTGKFEISYNHEGQTITKSLNRLNNYNKNQIKSLMTEQENLRDRALKAQTYQDKLDNLLNKVRATILPGFEKVSGVLENLIDDFNEWEKKNKIFDRIADFTKTAGEWIAENPIKSGLVAAALVLGKEAAWLLRGRILGMGFNQVASVGAFGGGSGLSRGKMARGRNIVKYGKRLGPVINGTKAIGRFAAPIAGIGLGVNAIENFTDSSLTGGEKILKTLDQNKFMGIGAAIGSIVPGIGTAVGAGIGGIIDWLSQMGDSKDSGLIGNYGSNQPKTQVFNDFISRPGTNPIAFSSKDTLIGAKKGGPIDKILDNNIKNSGTTPQSVKLEFTKPLRVEGKINVDSNGSNFDLDLNNPLIIRELTRVIQEQFSKGLSGGKISSVPLAFG